MNLTVFHSVLANAMIYFSVAYGLWGLVNYLRRQAPGPNYWGTLVVAEGLYVVQALVGIVMLLQGLRPGRGVHILYGILAVISLPAAYTFTRGEQGRRACLWYGLIGLFLAGVAIRGIMTARG